MWFPVTIVERQKLLSLLLFCTCQWNRSLENVQCKMHLIYDILKLISVTQPHLFILYILYRYILVNNLHELPVSCFPGVPVSKWDHHTANMDFQHRAGGKTGSGGVASTSESNRDRRERLRQLALETIDINKDPYFMKNHLGSYECKLCLTLHNNEVWKFRIWLEM